VLANRLTCKEAVHTYITAGGFRHPAARLGDHECGVLCHFIRDIEALLAREICLCFFSRTSAVTFHDLEGSADGLVDFGFRDRVPEDYMS
jgi:hypothetical protein